MRPRFLSPLLLLVIVAGAAPADAPPTFTPEQIEFFEKEIRPLLVKSCLECHGPDLQESGLRLDSRSGVLHGVEGHPAAVPGDPGRSPIIAVTRYDGDVQMPPDGKLPDDQLAALTNWVKLGLPWPDEATPAATPPIANDSQLTDATWGGSMADRIAQARDEHWAFQSVRKPQPPRVPDPAWMQNPIDRFVYAKLAEAGLQPGPEADPRTLIRRAYFDLVGLPPTPEEVDEFYKAATVGRGLHPDRDQRSRLYEEAYEMLVDKLLASPRYGERWARHWLDVARYADTKGYAFQQEGRFPFAYTYRDYVIRAFNDDKPYDEFIVEQLAADKLPPQPGDARLAALGFITCGRQYQGMHDTLDDQIDVVTRGLLGLTAACARCHDHKFDPIPTDDYYSLYGVFRSTVEPGEYPLLGEPIPSPEYDAFKQELAKLTAERDRYVDEQLAKLIDETRSRTADYLAQVVVERLAKSSSKEAVRLYEDGDLRPTVVRRWREFLTSAKRVPDGVFRAWQRFDALKEAEFAARAPAVAAALLKEAEGGKPETALNSLVAEALRKQTPQSMLDVAKLYGALFERVETDWRKTASAASREPDEPAPAALPEAAAEALRQVLYRPDSPATLTLDEARRLFDRKIRGEIEARERKIDQLVVTSPGAPPRAMSVVDAATPFDPKVFVRGDAARLGKPVPRQFLQVLAGDDRKPFAEGSGRLELARAIASRDNPLTARVLVNRVWQQHFGRGLVDTPSDFGIRTPPPSHPELLDYLAAEFMDEGWSIKRLHRTIMTSQTYRRASGGIPAPLAARATAVDAENRLLWKMNRRRLELEPMRDAMLAVAGKLDATEFGRPVELWTEPFSTRRTVYGFIDRQDLPGVFAVFDFANPDVTIDQRPRTSVPQQALFAMNSPFVMQQAQAVVARPEIAAASEPAARIEALYRTVLNRLPTTDELSRVRRYLDDAAAAPAVVEPRAGQAFDSYTWTPTIDRTDAPADEKWSLRDDFHGPATPVDAWETLAQVLLMSNEFMFVD